MTELSGKESRDMVNSSKGNGVEFPEYVISEYTGRLGTVITTDAGTGRFRVDWSGVETTMEWLGGWGEHWRPCLTRAKAQASLKIVQEYIDQKYGPGWEPKLYEPGHEGFFWNISLEGAEEWALQIGGYDETPFPEGVFAEPVFSWCLALYPTS